MLFRAPAAVEYIELYACVSSSDNPSQGSPSRSLQIHCCEDQSTCTQILEGGTHTKQQGDNRQTSRHTVYLHTQISEGGTHKTTRGTNEQTHKPSDTHELASAPLPYVLDLGRGLAVVCSECLGRLSASIASIRHVGGVPQKVRSSVRSPHASMASC